MKPSPGERLRAALAAGPVAIPGVFNALVARMAERLGFQAGYLSGGALAAGWAGLPDVGLITQTECADQGAVIARSTRLPLLADADTGFGAAIHVERTVRLYEAAGLAGLHMEDQELPKRCGHLTGKELIPTEEMVRKIRAAVAARLDKSFLLIARTDARSVEGFDHSITRARAYLAAGADGIFPEALETAQEFADFAREVPTTLIANMTEFGRSPLLDVATLGKLGYSGVLFPLTAFRSAMQAAWITLENLRAAGHQREAIPAMLTRARLYDLIAYEDFDARDKVYFGTTSKNQ